MDSSQRKSAGGFYKTQTKRNNYGIKKKKKEDQVIYVWAYQVKASGRRWGYISEGFTFG